VDSGCPATCVTDGVVFVFPPISGRDNRVAIFLLVLSFEWKVRNFQLVAYNGNNHKLISIAIPRPITYIHTSFLFSPAVVLFH